ncbi:MAG: hypothetical protein V2A62_02155 [Candidatus Woesearchaeota archaeon]
MTIREELQQALSKKDFSYLEADKNLPYQHEKIYIETDFWAYPNEAITQLDDKSLRILNGKCLEIYLVLSKHELDHRKDEVRGDRYWFRGDCNYSAGYFNYNFSFIPSNFYLSEKVGEERRKTYFDWICGREGTKIFPVFEITSFLIFPSKDFVKRYLYMIQKGKDVYSQREGIFEYDSLTAGKISVPIHLQKAGKPEIVTCSEFGIEEFGIPPEQARKILQIISQDAELIGGGYNWTTGYAETNVNTGRYNQYFQKHPLGKDLN